MPLETSFNVNPYFDDYDQGKEFYRILFKPGVSVQTRELNQLQSIIQNQIEKFGNHVFKSGTIVSGVNFTYIPTYSFAKILDTQADGQPSLPSSYVGYFVKSSLNLTARIVNYQDGLESQSPDLKTLFLQYVSSSDADIANGSAVYTSYGAGQQLTVFSKDYPIFKVTVNNGGQGFSNSDTVVVTSSITVSGNTVAFSNGEALTQSTTGAKVVIASINTTAVANTIILKVKPRAEDLTNNAVNSAAWSLSSGFNVIGNTSGATANVITLIGSSAQALVTTDTQGIIQTITPSSSGTNYTYLPTITVKTSNSSATVNALDLAAQNYKTTITVGNSSVNSIGTGYAFGVSEGVIYQKGYFLKVDPQIVVVNKYSTLPSNVAVGFTTVETTIDANADESLFDNASNTTNYSAPGADRLKLTPQLVVLTSTAAAANVDFFALAEWKDGNAFKENRTTIYSNLADEFSRRTREAQGDYVVDPFDVATREKTTANNTHLDIVIDPGLGYIYGNRVRSVYNNYISIPKSTTYSTYQNQSITVNYGNYVMVNCLAGLFNFKAGDTVSLRDTAKTYVSSVVIGTSGAITPAGNQIGTARIRSLVLDSGVPGSPGATYRLYLFDVTMSQGYSFRNVRGIYYDGAVQDGIADVVTVIDTTTGTAIAELVDTSMSQMVFGIGQPAVKALRNISYQYRTVSTSALQLTAAGQLIISSLGAGLTFPYSDGALTSTQKKDLIVFPVANTQGAANIAGTITVTTGVANVTGVSTTFASDLKVGDYIKFANTSAANTVGQIKTIANNTFLTLYATAAASVASANGVIFYPALYPLPLETRSERSVTISGTSSILTLDIGRTTSGTVNAIAVYNVKSSNATPVTKTINRDIYVKIHTSNNVGSNTGPWALGIPGTARLKNVYIGDATTVNTNSTDVTKHFYIDTGDDENAHRNGRLVMSMNAGVSLTNNSFMLVKLDAFTTGGAEGLFTVGSYSLNDTANLASSTSTINTLEIPEVTSKSGAYYDLRDCFDFRPFAVNTAVLSTTVAGAAINPANTFALSGDDQFFPVPDSTVSFDVDYYQRRVDRVVVNKDESFKVLQGISSINQALPHRAEAGTLTLAVLKIPPYPTLGGVLNATYNEFNSKLVGNQQGLVGKRARIFAVSAASSSGGLISRQPKRYTMNDIGKLDRRLQAVEQLATLNTVESEIKGLVLPSGITPSTERFKNGFLSDTFEDYSKIDRSNREFAATIDAQKGFLKPPTKQMNFESQFDLSDATTNNCVIVDSTGIKKLILPYTSEVLIDQSIKSAILGSDGHRVQFVGSGIINPPSFSVIARGEITKRVVNTTVEDPPPPTPPTPGIDYYNYGGDGTSYTSDNYTSDNYTSDNTSGDGG
jgi:hypothetical protein